MTALDPDGLAELEREQSYLLRSLDDLDAERRAGDLSEHDHVELTNDYTRRLAEVTRALDERREAFADIDTRLSTGQRVVTIGAVVIVALLAGVLLARASGFRSPTDSLSGDIRQSSSGLLAEADTLTREGRWEEAIDVYDEVLDVAPSNLEALTYRGWISSRLGEPTQGLVDIDEAIAIDPAYPDARVFRAILLDDAQRFDEAAEELAVLDTLDVPAQIAGLVDGSGLRASVVGGQIVTRFSEPGTTVDLDQLSASSDDVLAAGLLLIDLDTELSLRVFDAVLERDPDNVTALVASGNIQTNPAIASVSRDTAELGLERLDRAVELLPDDSQLRLARASARVTLDDTVGAAEDLARIDPAELPDAFVPAYQELLAEVG